jgi:hypothetical protein
MRRSRRPPPPAVGQPINWREVCAELLVFALAVLLAWAMLWLCLGD